ncbi:hypothetical protein EKO27_g4933 [Xylaria grammica]|uniref:Uncharacterized protein n=1 Tax=Xylaria grammica TaxID=363999 RepID=A0A439D6Y4_9PEZI|nr:hypothetical protein EKO27_g4933 [Xylaria grammica]
MGWWDSLWASSTSADDPLRKLDPKLREFLEKESPIRYNSNEASQKPADPTSSIPRAEADSEGGAGSKNESAVPRESQFQDGRYAHLWKSYRPLAEVEAETKSDHEKLMDILEGYKERKSQIGRAALENCALEQVDWRTCMSNPSWSEQVTQSPWLSLDLRPTPAGRRGHSMHADSLYQRLMKQESEIEAAKKEGRPIPKFAPLIPRPMADAVTPEPELTPEQQETLRLKLEKVPEEDRAAEEEAIRGELRAKADVASRVQSLWQQQDLERQIRKQKGEETLWDRAAGVFSSDSNDQEKKN